MLSRSSCIRRLHASHHGTPAGAAATARQRQQQRARRRQQRLLLQCAPRAAAANEPAVPENVDMSDPELQQQIDALLQELDPELLMEDTRELISAAAAAAAQQQQEQAAGQQPQQQQQQPELPHMGPAFQRTAAAWQEDQDSEETEGGLPEGVVLTKAEYRRKAAILVELMSAQRNEAGTASEAFMQQLSAFRVDVDEAMLHMLSKRLEVARHHGEDAVTVGQLQELQSVLTLEFERAQATPAMRLLDEVLDLLGDDPSLPGGKERTEAVITRLRAAFTGGASDTVDIFAAAAALAEDKALAADVLSVEFVPQPVFLSEGSQLLQQARQEMEALSEFVTAAQTELQQIRNSQPELLENPEAQQQIQQLMQADEVLQQRKAAVAQLALVLELSKDLEAAQASLDAPPGPEAAAAALLNDPEQLAQMLGIDDDESEH